MKAPMKPLALKPLVLLLLCPASAIAQTHMMMPEGSKDIYLSLGAVYGPRTEGGADNVVSAGPLISVQWANGVFIDMNTVGYYWSRKMNMAYGPMFTPSFSRVLLPGGAESKRRFTPTVGGFWSYQVAHGLSLNSNLMYGGSYDRRGLVMNVGVNTYLPVAAHHTIGASANVTLANRSALQANYAVTPQQAALSGLPEYEVDGGVRKSNVGVSWRWQMSNKYALSTHLRREQLHGSAAASPRMEQDSAVRLYTLLTYHW
jgi:outer membrane protein